MKGQRPLSETFLEAAWLLIQSLLVPGARSVVGGSCPSCRDKGGADCTRTGDVIPHRYEQFCHHLEPVTPGNILSYKVACILPTNPTRYAHQ